MVAESVPIKRETYLSILMDSTTNGPVCKILTILYIYILKLVVACPSGGVDIEEIAKKSPELILKVSRNFHTFRGRREGTIPSRKSIKYSVNVLKEPIPIDAGISAKQCFKIAAFLEFEGKLAEKVIY